ncbi:hypothetical protein ACFWN2_11175 [Lentzea sp. NPDC058436]|uniref:hypothetical protein n=1 Tax=Lentzea sp. NPDC058436 TaxID=3346499 RepID=UPI003660253C
MTPPFDAEDLRLLDELQALYAAVEPVPAELVACAQFAVDVESTDFGIARIEDSAPLQGAGARGTTGTQITFDCGPELAVMVQIQVRDDGDVRIDGWLTPPGDQQVELRTEAGTTAVEVSPEGRFAVDHARRGLVQFVVRAAGTTVVTPAIVV